MKAVIVGTAGHIDHGKSALVRALTGTDPDRLEEEKRRGITIDIGFANLDLDTGSADTIRLGFIDVPGHERFVRNMLAGIGGIDLVLLVIAADESVKPQTREHFDICRLLSVRRGITVLTKADLVDEDTLEVVRLEVADFLKGSFLDPARAPIVAVSSKTGAGLELLKSELLRIGAEVPAKDSEAVFRLPIDRVFTMKGFGTVVTGTLISGAVRKEHEVEIHPTGRRLRVRGVQVHNQPAEQAIAGQRTAINLAGIETSDLARGMMLTPAGIFHPTARASVRLDLLAGAKPLRDRARVHLHAFTAETIAEVNLLESKVLKPGTSGLARVKLDDPMLLLPGDRFIVRQFSPVITIGGGRVLDASEPQRRIKATERLAFLQTLEQVEAPEALLTRVARRGANGMSLAEAVAETGWLAARVETLAAELKQANKVMLAGELLIDADILPRLSAALQAEVDRFHQDNPLVAGISKEELRERMDLRVEVFQSALDAAVRSKKIAVSSEHVHAAGRGVVMRDEEAESKKQIEAVFVRAGLQVPALKDVLASLPIDKGRAQKIVTLLLRDRVLVKLGDELVFHHTALDKLRNLVVAQKPKTPKLNVAVFKDLAGVSRKYAIPLLEYLDRERVTRRVGDERLIL